MGDKEGSGSSCVSGPKRRAEDHGSRASAAVGWRVEGRRVEERGSISEVGESTELRRVEART
eukprot:1385413-Rhodomonas_salina.2